jgi:hypothetical protein
MRTIERALWAATLSALAVAALLRGGSAKAESAIGQSPVPATLHLPTLANADSLEEAVGIIAEGNLFRPERSSADPAKAVSVATSGVPPSSMRPRLVLRGILGGPPWDALIDGIPGRDGALVIRVGQTIAGITVRVVRRDTVFVRGFDTTWTLTLGRNW